MENRSSKKDPRKKGPIKVCLWGAWYGSKNIGDQALLISIARLLMDRAKDAKIIVLSENARSIEAYAAAEGLRVVALNKWREIHRTLHALATTDLLAIGGGVPFYDKWQHLLVFLFLVFSVKACGGRVMTYAPSTQILKSPLSRWTYKFILNRLDLITIREPWTLSQFRALGVKKKMIHTADPVLTLKAAPRERIDEILEQEGLQGSEGKPLIGITTRKLSATHRYRGEHYRQLSEEDILHFQESVAAAADFLSTLGQVLFIPMNTEDPDDDRKMAQIIIGKMKCPSVAKAITKKYTAPETMGIIGRCSFLLGNRVHSIILAAATFVPFVAIAYDLKFIGITERVHMGDYNLDIVGLNTEKLISKIEKAWQEKEVIRKELSQTVEDVKKFAELNADLAVQLCYREPINVDDFK